MTTLLYSGNVGLGQDLGTVMRAMARLNGEADLKLRIVGGGKGLPEYKELASQLQLPDVEFRPPVPLGQLSTLLAEGDIHVICQKPGTEGLLVPSKTYGTLAAGRPSLFVGPAKCEVAAIIDDSRSGFAVEPGDVEGAAAALKTLIESPALREDMGRNARDYYEYYFGREKSVARIIEIIEKSCGVSGSDGDGRGEARGDTLAKEGNPSSQAAVKHGTAVTLMGHIRNMFDLRWLGAALLCIAVLLKKALGRRPETRSKKYADGE